jgi:hypothetical protein
MPQVASKVSYRSLAPLLGRTAARTLRPALARTAKQPHARGGTFRGSEVNDRCLKSLRRFLIEASLPYWDEPLHEPYVQPSREQPNSPTRGRPLILPAPSPPVKALGAKGGQAVGWSGREV